MKAFRLMTVKEVVDVTYFDILRLLIVIILLPSHGGKAPMIYQRLSGESIVTEFQEPQPL